MNQISNHNAIGWSSSQTAFPRTQEELQPYPVDVFPPVIRDVINALHKETTIPVEIIGNIALTAVSLACQTRVDIIPPYSKIPESCSLYLMTIAESGDGKTTIYKQLMKPFYEFSSSLKQEYELRLAGYKSEHSTWKVIRQALDSNLRQSIKKGYSGEDEAEKINRHALNEPRKPARPNIIYEDTTLKALIEGLSDYPAAGFISDEAITFFKSKIKNNPGLLNKAWDGSPYDFRRADGEIYELTPQLTCSLMAQPGVFMDYLTKHGDTARSSGFLSRFLFSRAKNLVGSRDTSCHYGYSDDALAAFHARIEVILNRQENFSHQGESGKITLTLTEDASQYFRDRYNAIEKRSAPEAAWSHIRDITAKSGASALRMAALLRYFHDDEADCITQTVLEKAFTLMDWYLNQACVLFYPMSENYQFEKDVRELCTWIKARFQKNNGFPFLKNDIEKFGPHRLRRTDKLIPVLNQLISQGGIGVVQVCQGAAMFISKEMPDGTFMPPPVNLPYGMFQVIQSRGNTFGRGFVVNLEGT